MQKVQGHDEETLGSGSTIADLDNETDTFGREIMQHERDARRLQNATRGQSQPLLKPRARPRISELVARREREEEAASGQQQHIRAGSTGSNDSNPPLNVPREWGTRAKSHRGWMRKIRESSVGDMDTRGHVADKGLLTPEEDDVPRRTSYGSNNIWNREDEQAISTEHTPPSMKRARPNVQQTKIRDANSTLRHIIDSEDHEFSELSLLTSTPATTKPLRNGFSRDDNEVNVRQRTTYRHQDYLSERSPNRNATHGRYGGAALEFDDKRTVPKREDSTRPATASYAEARLARRSGLISNKENLPAEDARDGYPQSNDNVTIADRTARAVTFRQQQRSSRAGNGSLHLLQRLATSLSPNTGKMSSEPLQSSANDLVQKENKTDVRPRTSGLDRGNPVQPVRRIARRKSNNSQSDDADLLSRDSSAERKEAEKTRLDETPLARENPQENKTPVVTGAWVDTPGPVKDARPPIASSQTAPVVKPDATSQQIFVPEKSGQQTDRAPHGDPNRPRSVLEEIVRDARNDPASAFGDATIQSLEGIVHPNTDPTDTTVSFDTAENLDIGRPLTQAEKDRRQEDLAIEAMNKHLRAARTSIKDADRGLQRVENKWEETSQIEAPRTTANPVTKTKEVVRLDRNWRTACDHCGGSYHSLWWGLWTELRSIFYVYDKNARYGFRLSWPGILVLAWLLWNILENLLCYYYCHPLYAEFMTGFGVNPDAPRYPFVIPTLLFRPLRPIWRPAFTWLEASCTTALYTIFGEPVRPRHKMTAPVQEWGYPSVQRHAEQVWTSTWTGRAASTAVAAARRATKSFVDAVDAFGGETMNDDEYL